MPILIIDVARALWALRFDAGAMALASLTAIAIVGGTVVYWAIEGLTLLDAAYLSVTTLTTVGYGDPAPETAAGKIFTCFFAVLGIGILLAFLSALAAQIREQSVMRKPLAGLADPKSAQGTVADYDVLVIGSDEESRRTALEAAQLGLRVVVKQDGLPDPTKSMRVQS
jgi:voltage-gated potassium channel